MYCIYCDSDVPESAGNADHVIPLSLGGLNGFEIWADRNANSTLGSLEGRLGRDFFLAFALREANVRGHSGKASTPTWRNVEMDGRPMQMSLGNERIVAWDAKDRRELTEEELAGKTFNATVRLDIHLTTRFLAKVALGAGYFIYGGNFRTAVDCSPLRDLALQDLEDVRKNAKLLDSGIKICDRFHEDSQSGGEAHVYRSLLENLGRSAVISIPHSDAIAFHIGIVGQYVGSIVCQAETAALPSEGDHDLGHVIALAPGDLERMSFRAFLRDFWRGAYDGEPPGAPA